MSTKLLVATKARKALRHCEYGVEVLAGYPPEPDIKPCDEPAVALWTWGLDEESYSDLAVCEEHDNDLEEDERTPMDWQPSGTLQRYHDAIEEILLCRVGGDAYRIAYRAIYESEPPPEAVNLP